MSDKHGKISVFVYISILINIIVLALFITFVFGLKKDAFDVDTKKLDRNALICQNSIVSLVKDYDDRLNKIVENSLKDSALYEEVSDRLDASGLSLSGGQQQRLCIARTIAMSPDVILMDEPTSALDPIATLKIEELIKELKKKYTIIIVTHNMQQAARISDYTAFFMLGELVEFNQTEEFFAHPCDKRSEDYITGRFG